MKILYIWKQYTALRPSWVSCTSSEDQQPPFTLRELSERESPLKLIELCETVNVLSGFIIATLPVLFCPIWCLTHTLEKGCVCKVRASKEAWSNFFAWVLFCLGLLCSREWMWMIQWFLGTCKNPFCDFYLSIIKRKSSLTMFHLMRRSWFHKYLIAILGQPKQPVTLTFLS